MMSPKKLEKIKELLEVQKKALIKYLLVKVDEGDWHAVQDAASDIREINAQLSILSHIYHLSERGEEQ